MNLKMNLQSSLIHSYKHLNFSEFKNEITPLSHSPPNSSIQTDPYLFCYWDFVFIHLNGDDAAISIP